MVGGVRIRLLLFGFPAGDQLDCQADLLSDGFGARLVWQAFPSFSRAALKLRGGAHLCLAAWIVWQQSGHSTSVVSGATKRPFARRIVAMIVITWVSVICTSVGSRAPGLRRRRRSLPRWRRGSLFRPAPRAGWGSKFKRVRYQVGLFDRTAGGFRRRRSVQCCAWMTCCSTDSIAASTAHVG